MAGLTPIQAMEIVRGLRGLNIIGGDLVEVSCCLFYLKVVEDVMLKIGLRSVLTT